MPIYASEFIPKGQGLLVTGYGAVVGIGPETPPLDNLGLDVLEEAGVVLYDLPKWAIFFILAAALMLLVLLI